MINLLDSFLLWEGGVIMKWSKLCGLALAAMMSLNVGMSADAMPREDIAKISVNQAGDNFQYWNENSVAKNKLVSYMKDITNPNSLEFIPVEDRIAVFDMDGTLISETTPYYFEWMLYLDQIEAQKGKLSQEMLDNAAVVKEAIANHAVTDDIDAMETVDKAKLLAGLTREEMKAVVGYTMDKPADGLTNLKRGEAFYLPMAEVVSFLKANDFTVYIVSGADRDIARYTVEGVLPIKVNNIIGADVMRAATNQNGVINKDYVFKKGQDKVIRTEQLISQNTGFNKVVAIDKEIAKKPVLAFGNSSGDLAMYEYTLSDNKYKSMAFALCCDDVVREYGNLKKADKMAKQCQENGWVAVSMANDWKTIYGDDVIKTK